MASDIKINLDSKHLPQTAAAWQAWKIILATFACGVVGVVGSLLLVAVFWVFTAPMRETQTDKLRKAAKEQCMAQFLIENNGMRADTGFSICTAKSKLQYP
jgi:hypothetical protein